MNYITKAQLNSKYGKDLVQFSTNLIKNDADNIDDKIKHYADCNGLVISDIQVQDLVMDLEIFLDK